MLIEFSVSNFRSFREQRTLSMVAAPRLGKKQNTFSPNVVGEKLPDLLKVAAIYGPNASGKSNLIKAMGLIRRFARLAPSASSDPLPVAPFRFDPELLGKPSVFEVHFVQKNRRYSFYLSATSERIIEEKLFEYPRGKECMLYSRVHVDGEDRYEFGSDLEGDAVLHTAWQNLTNQKTLFIAQAVANSNESLKQLRTPFTWLQTGVTTMYGGMNQWAIASQKLAKDDPHFASEISEFLQRVDVPVTNIEFKPIENFSATNEKGSSLSEKEESTMDFEEELAQSKTTLTHRTSLGEAQFEFSDESRGTKNLIGFWLPWNLLNRSRPRDGHFILSVDELDSSLHPEIVASLIKQHIDRNTDRQLIFTTHDTHVMNSKLLRRDQFWIVERESSGATTLRSIHDFQGREGEQIEKRYYEGRYRGLPITRNS